MNVIAVDCALDACQVAVLRGDALSVCSEAMRKGHAERIAGMARDAMAQAGLGFEGIDRIAVTVGPGSFAGVRVGLAFARGLAVALEKPCLGFSTLELFARGEGDSGLRAGAIPAPEAVFLGVWQDGGMIHPPARLSLEEARARLPVGCAVFGPGAASLGHESADVVPSVAALARLAAVADPAHRAPDPLYLRPPYANLPEA